MTQLRVEGVAELAINMLVNPDIRSRIEGLLHAAGETTAEALTMVGREARWGHTLDFRCEPVGRHVDGLDTASMMDSHDEMAGTILVGCRSEAVDHLASLLTTLDSGHDLEVSERAQEATNIIGSAYLNGLRTALDSGRAVSSDSELGFSERSFLPSPPRFLKVLPETMLELAVGGQGMGDRGWIADHRLRFESAQIIVLWVPSSQAIIRLGAHEVVERVL